MVRRFKLAIFAFLLIQYRSAVNAQQATTEDPELKRLQSELAIATARANIAEQEKKLLGQQPGAAITGLQGTTTIDDQLSFEVESTAYSQLRAAAQELAAEVKKSGAKRVVIMDDSLAIAFRNLRAFEAQVEILKEDSVALRTRFDRPPVTSAIGAISAGARSLIDLLSLFRADTDFKGRAVTVRDRALIASVAEALREEGIQAMFPKTFPPGVLGAVNPKVQPYRGLADVRGEREQLAMKLKEAEEKEAAATKELNGTPAPTPERKEVLKDEIERLKRFRTDFAAQIKLIDDFVTVLTKSDSTGVSPLASLITAAGVANLFNGRDGQATFLLDMEVSKAGGSYRITRTLWHNLFTGPSLRHSGGVIASYSLLDQEANIVRSGVITKATKFRRPYSGPELAGSESGARSRTQR
jgi:hypothetical protein